MEFPQEKAPESASATMSEALTPRAFRQMQVDAMNAVEGHLHERDGYHCAKCKNRGYIFRLEETRPGAYREYAEDCRCAEVRRSILRMHKSGLRAHIRECSFEKFETPEPWQKTLKRAAMAYAEAPQGWFFIGGQSGAGKSMLCTAICRELLLRGFDTVYMRWTDEVARLKALATDAQQRTALMEGFKSARLLYIDDLFKSAADGWGVKQRPTGADVRTAFEILNSRYNDPKRLTVISSEWSQDELLEIDEAIGGRIFERAGKNGFSIAPSRQKNYRTRGAVTL